MRVRVQHVPHRPSRESWPCRLQGGPALCHVTCSGCSGPGPAAAPQMCPQRGLPAARPAPLGWDCRSCGGETFGSLAVPTPPSLLLVTGDHKRPLHTLPQRSALSQHRLSAHHTENNIQTPPQPAASVHHRQPPLLPSLSLTSSVVSFPKLAGSYLPQGLYCPSALIPDLHKAPPSSILRPSFGYLFAFFHLPLVLIIDRTYHHLKRSLFSWRLSILLHPHACPRR